LWIGADLPETHKATKAAVKEALPKCNGLNRGAKFQHILWRRVWQKKTLVV
jgi:hypothetical protein